MKIAIIGFGIVGAAQGHLLEKLGHQVFPFDPIKYPGKMIEQKVDLSFICTPEAAVEEVINDLTINSIEGLIVIKSTVPVGETKRLAKKYKVHICHNPEFLREKHSFEDVLDPDRIVIGECCSKHGNLLEKLYQPLSKPVYRTDPTTSEMTKLISNTYLSTLITFWNEVNELTKKVGVDTHELSRIVSADKRISLYGTKFFGEPFKGTCLPKDLKQLILSYKNVGLNPILYETIQDFNKEIGNKKNVS